MSKTWGFTAFILFLMAADEGAQIHELAFRLMGQIGTNWLVIIALAVMGGVVLGATMIRHLPNPVRTQLLTAGVVFASATLGLEVITSEYLDRGGSKASFTYNMLSHAEEGFEMTGIVLLLRALFRHLPLSATTAATVDTRVAAPTQG